MIALHLSRGLAALAVLGLGLLSGCGVSDPTARLDDAEVARLNADLASPDAGTSYLSGTTALSINDNYGSQVEYLAPDGRSYLWFPGQIRTTPGQWRVNQTGDGVPVMCFLYGSNSYDPVQGTTGGAWECGPLGLYLTHLSQLAKGDPFGLRDGVAPFPMVTLPYALDLNMAQDRAGGKVSQRPLTFVFDRFKR